FLALTYAFAILRLGFHHNLRQEIMIVSLFSTLFILPWMMDMFRSSGTFLYPVFGAGYVEKYQEFIQHHFQLLDGRALRAKVGITDISFIVLAIVALFAGSRSLGVGWARDGAMALLLSAGAGTAIVFLHPYLAASPWDVYRYAYSFVMASFLIEV